MTLWIRPATRDDAVACGQICFDAFAAIADRHGFPRDFDTVSTATNVVAALIDDPRFFGVVADQGGEVIGSNFLDLRSAIWSVGPVTVAPRAQNRQVGRKLMTAALDYARERPPSSVRLMQSGYHLRSLSLYAKLGFTVRESYAVLQGRPPRGVDTSAVRLGRMSDLPACDALCRGSYGVDRHGEVSDAMRSGAARVLERAGRITGYSTGVGLFGHSVAETTTDLQTIIAAADEYSGTGFLLPTHDGHLLRWCLDSGLQVVSLMNLMTLADYRRTSGPHLASVGY